MTAVRDDAIAEPVGDTIAMLGEGPYWVPEDDVLLWVDIKQGRLHRTSLPSGDTVTDDLGEVSAAFPALDGGIVTAEGNRLTFRALPSPAGSDGTVGSLQQPARTIAEVPARDGIRFNDAGVDPAGRVWVGSMHTGETEPLGELYRLDPLPDGSGTAVLTPVLTGVTVSNGLGWSPDGSRMYYADSPMRRIDVFDYDPAVGEASGRRVFADLSQADGMPDGLTVDADGYLWVAMWDGGVLRRIAPDGSLDGVLRMPVSRPTSCAFGGPGLAELYVTTARFGLSEAALDAEPLAGRLLRVRPGPIGLPSTTARAATPW